VFLSVSSGIEAAQVEGNEGSRGVRKITSDGKRVLLELQPDELFVFTQLIKKYNEKSF